MPVATASRRSVVRLAGFAAVAVFLALVARFWNPVHGFTSFIQLDASNDDLKIAAFRELPVYVHRDTGGYDGLYYAQIAYHPALDAAELRPAMDNFAYRAQRILPPALAWLLAAGQPAWIVHVYSLLNVAAWLALAALLWRLLAVEDFRGWLAWAGVLFSAGALSSVRLALTDLVALAILAGAMLAAERGRPRLAATALAAAGLARETSLLTLTGTLERPWFSWKNLGRIFSVVAPLAAWLCYVRWRVGVVDPRWENFTLPVAGFIQKWRASIAAVATIADHTLAWTTLLATFALTVQVIYLAVRPRVGDRWWRIGAGYVTLMFCFGPAVWEGFPGAATRVLLPMNLAFNVLVHRSRAALAWMLAGNLTVFAGLLALRDVPNADSREMTAVRLGGVAAVARIADGWSGIETHREHTWVWTDRRGLLVLEAWPVQTRVLRLDFALRSLAPRTVTVRHDGREILRKEIGPAFSHLSLPVPLVNGRAMIEFATDTPGVREGPGPNARELAFALYDPQLSVSEK